MSIPAGRSSERRAGFTLIELVVVVSVIALLATLVAPNVFRHLGAANESTARAQLEMLGAALDTYRMDVGRYPTEAEGLGALWEAPPAAVARWRGPYLRKPVPLDPWGNSYVYRNTTSFGGAPFTLLSLGADGTSGGDGEGADLSLW